MERFGAQECKINFYFFLLALFQFALFSLLQSFICQSRKQMESPIRNSQQEPQGTCKRKTKKSKLLQAKSIYICECSKIYLSFPALYLHVKNKHNVKLTSRIDDQVCKIEQKKGKTYFTFFYSQSCPENKPQQDLKFPKQFINPEYCLKTGCQHLSWSGNLKENDFDSFEAQKLWEKKQTTSNVLQVSNLIQTYLQTPEMLHSYQSYSAKVVLGSFVQYIEKSAMMCKQFQNMKNSQSQMLVESLPLLFNEFIFYYLPQNLSATHYYGINKNAQVQIIKMFANWLTEHRFTNFIVLDNL